MDVKGEESTVAVVAEGAAIVASDKMDMGNVSHSPLPRIVLSCVCVHDVEVITDAR